jgi:mannose/cellobiose epimerase-like protein (N-acyl-D-glucosamine 2-epimerase family)
MQYQVISDKLLDALVELVNDALDDGWKLQGGVAISSSTDQGHTRKLFAQAMIKESE